MPTEPANNTQHGQLITGPTRCATGRWALEVLSERVHSRYNQRAVKSGLRKRLWVVANVLILIKLLTESTQQFNASKYTKKFFKKNYFTAII